MSRLRVFAGVLACAAPTLACITPCPARTLWVDGGSTARVEDGSTDAAFRTIGAALQVAKPGDTVTVRTGTYREQVRMPAGEPERPITLRAAEGQRVVMTGCVKLDRWERSDDGLWVRTLDWKPERLLVAGKTQTIARKPNEGWWRSVEADDDSLVDPEHLRGLQAAETGGEVRVWLQRGNVFDTFALRSLDTRTGRVTVDGTEGRLSNGDKYYLENRAEFIDQPGEWAVEPDAGQYRVFFRPRAEDDLARVEAPHGRGSLVLARNASHVRIEGLELVGAQRDGIEVSRAADVVIRRCVAYRNGRGGITLRDAEDSVVTQNIVWRNGHGISVSYSTRVTIEQNDVGYNEVDGLLVTWKSNDIAVRQNYSHHHLLWGHPDNLQVYRGVSDVRFQENLFLAGGQSVMTEETRDGVFEGNMIVGCGANMLIFGHGNAGHYRIHNNTLAFSGYGCMNLTWEDYDVRENVMMTGHGGTIFGVRGIRGYEGDRNVFFNSRRASNPKVMATDTGWHRDFDLARASTGQDKNSLYADPKFRNAPVAFRVFDGRQLEKCTKETWYLRGGTEGFRQGDYVEVNFDGVPRRVTGVDEAAITVSPGLREKPIKGWLVANWGENPDFRLDLRLADDSPGAKLSATGGPVGSRIDIQAYLRGDFNADGKRDLPEMPSELADD